MKFVIPGGGVMSGIVTGLADRLRDASAYRVSYVVGIALFLLLIAMHYCGIDNEPLASFAPAITGLAAAVFTRDDWKECAVAGALPWGVWIWIVSMFAATGMIHPFMLLPFVLIESLAGSVVGCGLRRRTIKSSTV